MKTLMKIGEYIAAGLIMLGSAFTLLFGFIIALPHAKRYMHIRSMSAE